MTLQQLEYIVSVDKYRHFAKAAGACGVSQSTLSALIQKLEQELDVTIFDRSSHPIKPTAIGEEIVARAKKVLFDAAQVRELVSTRKGESIGRVSLGMISTVTPYLLPKIFRYMSANHPDIQLHVEEARVQTIISKLEKGEIDVALMATPVNNDELLEIPLYKERLMVYAAKDTEIHKLDCIPTASLPLEEVWVLREGYCPERGVFPFCNTTTGRRAIYEAGSIETLIRIVDENGGYAIIPELQLPLLNEAQRANVRRLTNPEPSREIALVVHRNFVRERLLNILADAIKAVISEEMIYERHRKYPIVI